MNDKDLWGGRWRRREVEAEEGGGGGDRMAGGEIGSKGTEVGAEVSVDGNNTKS